MFKYTVLLLYPAYLAEVPETYLAHISAHNPRNAGIIAQSQAASANEAVEDADDFVVAAIFHGFIDDIKE